MLAKLVINGYKVNTEQYSKHQANVINQFSSFFFPRTPSLTKLIGQDSFERTQYGVHLPRRFAS